jgi:hypothetical protein
VLLSKKMDIRSIEKAIVEIVERKKKLGKLDYNDEQYDQVEEELHDLEDNFIEKYGTYLEKALEEVHAKYCAENDILLPIAYLANTYEKVGEDEKGNTIYDVNYSQGVFVEVETMPGENTKLVIVPGPLRMVLVSPNIKEIVWTA